MLGIKATSSKRTYTSMPCLPGLQLAVPLTLQQAIVNPCICYRLPNTHRQVWLSHFWRQCSFSWVLVSRKLFLCPPRVCFPSPVEVL